MGSPYRYFESSSDADEKSPATAKKGYELDSLLLSVILLFSLSPRGLAKGIFTPPGSRAHALGTAFTGVADDLTSIYWNPAGLSQLDNAGVELSGLFAANRVTGNRSLRNVFNTDVYDGDFPWPAIYSSDVSPLLPNAEPDEYSKKEAETNAFLPFASAFTRVGETTIAFGFYSLGGGGAQWYDSINDLLAGKDTMTARVDIQDTLTVTNLSVARWLFPQFAAGLGLDWIQMSTLIKMQKSYLKDPASTVPSSYSIYGETSSRGAGFQGVGGILYAPSEILKIGAVIRSGTLIKKSGTASFSSSGFGFMGAPDTDYKSDFEQDYNYPMTYGFGLSYKITPSLLIAAGADISDYSVLKDTIRFKQQNNIFTDKDESMRWNDTAQYRLGTEYRVDERLSFQAGIYNDPAPLSQEKLTLLSTDVFNMTYLSVGAGYNFDIFSCNVSYTKGLSDRPEKDGRYYDFPVDVYRIDTGYRF